MKPSLNPLRELRAYIADVAIRFRADRNFKGLFHVGVIEDIAVDAQREQAAIVQTAYSAEQADLEAAKLLEHAARDGFSNADLPAVQKAVRLIRSSARHDRRVVEMAQA